MHREAAAGMCHRIYVIELPSAIGDMHARRVCTSTAHTIGTRIRVRADVCKMTANLDRALPGSSRSDDLSGNITVP